jgi:hypothetical protein
MYDNSSHEIDDPAKNVLDLKQGKTYRFVIIHVNSALFSLKINPQFLSKMTSVPPAIQQLSGVATLTITPTLSYYSVSNVDNAKKYNAEKDNNSNATKTSTQFNPIDYQLQKIDFDYNFIRYLLVMTKTLIKNVESDWNIEHSKVNALSTMASINLQYSFLNNGNDTCCLDKATDSVMTDIASRIELLKNYLRDNSYKDITDLNQIVSIYDIEAFIKTNQGFISKCSDVIKSVENCKDKIASAPIKVDKGDYLNLNTVLSRNNFAIKPDTISQNFTFYKTKYWKVDYSVGVFMNNIPNPTYHFTDTTGHIAKEVSYDVDFGIGALITFQDIVSSCFKVGASAGISLSVIDIKPRYLLGASFVFGRKQSFVFSLGGAGASIAVPTNSLDITSSGKIVSGFDSKNFTPTTVVPTYNLWKFGCFLGISYNFIPH